MSTQRQYRMIIDSQYGELEQRINDLGQEGFRPILMAMNENETVTVTMERVLQPMQNGNA
jgi:hypothetical protein